MKDVARSIVRCVATVLLAATAAVVWGVSPAVAAEVCTSRNDTDVAVPDLGTVESAVTLAGCTGNASVLSTVEVHVVHSYRGDLVVRLIAPDGSAYLLSNRVGAGADNLDQTFTVNLSSEPRNGTWRLRVQDAQATDTGFLDTWTIDAAAGSDPTCSTTNGTDIPIVDNATVDGLITNTTCPGNASPTGVVDVHVVHTYRGDLVVSLLAPDGSAYVLSNRVGGSADNLDQTFLVDLSSEPRNGTWRLRVLDAATADTGYINSWTLSL